MSSTPAQIAVDSIALIAIRAAYALICRRFLLSALNPTLRDLSAADTLPYHASRPANPLDLSETEDGLTTPGSSHAPSPSLQLRDLPSTSAQLTQVGDRLQERVLQLHHARQSSPGSTKTTTRGLSRLARALFSLCFAEGCTIITLVAFHALGVLHAA